MTVVTSARFEAMGTSVELLLHLDHTRSAEPFVHLARSLLERLESRWSRFRPESDVSRINRHAGRPVLVSRDTIDAVSRAVDAWSLTEGRFDPTIGSSLVDAGYDRPFDQIGPAAMLRGPMPTAGADTIVVHPTAMTIRVPEGVRIDLGGIGKGLAADLTVETLLDAGVRGALVNIGGDLRADGESVDDRGWPIRLDCPGTDEDRSIVLARGAVCTSSTVRRRWSSEAGDEHHLRAPDTGAAAHTDIVTASVIGARAAACEVLATCAVIDGSHRAAARIIEHGATGVFVTGGGRVIELPGLEEFA